MQISIWQQFSSNNSSSFTVVGQFLSSSDAQKAALEIQRLVVEIAKWYEKPENAAIRRKIGPPDGILGEPLTPIEIEYSRRYQIEWGAPIDWTVKSEVATQGVLTFENLLFVSNGWPLRDSMMLCHPIDALIERLGGVAWCDTEKQKFTVTCFASDDETVSRLLAGIQVLYLNDGVLGAKINDIAADLTSITTIWDSDEQSTTVVFEISELKHISSELPKLYAYLKEMGCSEVRYQFSS